MHCYKKHDKTHHEQYLLAANFTINEFFMFFNAFTANKLRATAARFTCFVSAAFTLAVLSLGLLVILDSSELAFPSSTNLEQSSSDNRKRYLRREIFEPVTNLYKMWALMAAKFNML